MKFLVIVVVLVLLALLVLSRSGRLFRISIQNGKQTVQDGYVPPALLNDFSSVVRHVSRGSISAHMSSGHPRLDFAGDIDDGVAQRLRNIFGLYKTTKWRR